MPGPPNRGPGASTSLCRGAIAASAVETSAPRSHHSASPPSGTANRQPIVLNAAASAAYIGVGLGPGPRDGLMTGLAARAGRSVRLVRTAIEVVVVLSGWLLGGVFGVVTVASALGVGPLVQWFLPRFTVRIPPWSSPQSVCPATDGREDR